MRMINIDLPYSKSEYNRSLVLHKLYADNLPKISDDYPDDCLLLHSLLTDYPKKVFDCKNAGTALRFLVSVTATDLHLLEKEKVTITGCERMQQRPIAQLVDVLRLLGAEIQYDKTTGFPPITISHPVDFSKKEVSFSRPISSQFISSLMMIAPLFHNGLTIHFNEIPSFDYVKMTSRMMNKIGLTNEISSNYIRIEKFAKINFSNLQIEKDWSSAANWYPFLLLEPKTKIKFNGLNINSLQGDEVIIEIMKLFSIDSIFDDSGIILHNNGNIPENERIINLTNTPDLAPAIATAGALTNGTTVIIGLKNLKWKESDRICAIENNLKILGIEAKADGDSIIIRNNNAIEKITSIKNEITLQSEEDHRIAMSCVPFTLINRNLRINNTDCVSKSYPNFMKEISEKLIPLHNLK